MSYDRPGNSSSSDDSDNTGALAFSNDGFAANRRYSALGKSTVVRDSD